MSASAASSQILKQQSAKSQFLKKSLRPKLKIFIVLQINQSTLDRGMIKKFRETLQFSKFQQSFKGNINLLEKEQTKIMNSIKNQLNDYIMTGLNKKRIINITLDCDLDNQTPYKLEFISYPKIKGSKFPKFSSKPSSKMASPHYDEDNLRVIN